MVMELPKAPRPSGLGEPGALAPGTIASFTGAAVESRRHLDGYEVSRVLCYLFLRSF